MSSLENRVRDSQGKFKAMPRKAGRPKLSPFQAERSKQRKKRQDRARYLHRKLILDAEKMHKEIDGMGARLQGISREPRKKLYIRNKNFQSNLKGGDATEVLEKTPGQSVKSITACLVGRTYERLQIPKDQRRPATEKQVIAAKVLYARYGLETARQIVAAYSRILEATLIARGLPPLPLMTRDFTDALLAAYHGKPSSLRILEDDLWQTNRKQADFRMAAWGSEAALREEKRARRDRKPNPNLTPYRDPSRGSTPTPTLQKAGGSGSFMSMVSGWTSSRRREVTTRGAW